MKKLVFALSVSMILSACDQSLEKYVDIKSPISDSPTETLPPGAPNAAGGMKVSPGRIVSGAGTVGGSLNVTPTNQKFTGATVGFQGGITKISR